ncbi:hypothetical protein TNIN_56371 [Trichonephila inaurata madagascariensis]|uniref:Uncharacterized protein n=1 Tax=Trichonephila inaurata madagascariensis TaxID=2747483 RepID=A0A8X7CV50_9ARAC|nr:hypothetical protein TNIN_56371 [Trichonephila inaurata madagascariensis]
MHISFNNKTQCIYNNVTFTAFYFLASIVTSRPLLSRFTDWLSIIPTDGVALCQPSLTFSQKYHVFPAIFRFTPPKKNDHKLFSTAESLLAAFAIDSHLSLYTLLH